MAAILAVARFELLYHLRRPAFYLFALLVVGQGIWYAYSTSQQYAGSNASVSAYMTLSSLGIALALIGVLLAGQSLTKDIDYRTHTYLYALPITSRAYLAGRFLGTYGTVLALAVCYPLGAIAESVLLPSAVTGIALWALADGFIRLLAVNAFIVVCLTFSLTILLRGIRGAYVVLFFVALYFLLSEAHTAVADSDLWLLLDPFGVSMVRESAEVMSLGDEPTGLFTFSDMLLINRFLWLGLSLGMLARAEEAFSFQTFDQPKLIRLVTMTEDEPQPTERSPLPLVQPTFTNWVRVRTVALLTRMEFKQLVGQPLFLITAGLLVLLTVLLATVFGQNPDFPELPLTAKMTALRLPMGTCIGLLLVIMTGELLAEERTVGFWPIYDALPQPTPILLLSKLLALAGLSGALTGTLLLTGLGVQAISGFEDIDWLRYGSDLLVDGWLRYVQLTALGAFVSALTGHRFVGHVVASLVFLALSVAYSFAPAAAQLSLYSFLPGSATFSDLTGYGSSETTRPVVHLMWWGLAGLFVSLALLVQQRGVATGLSDRFAIWYDRFNPAYVLSLLAFCCLFGVGAWVTIQRSGTPSQSAAVAPYHIQTVLVASETRRPVRVSIQYHHRYQVQHIARAVQQAIQVGEGLFGPFPYPSLRVVEMPKNQPTQSQPGQLLIAENQGWTADPQQPDLLDYIDYLITRETFNQWLVHRLKPARQLGDGFLRYSLAEYAALQVVRRTYGPERLSQRLAQRAGVYYRFYNRSRHPAPPLLQSQNNPVIERNRGSLVLTSIGQVWGDAPLSLTIGQFYRQAIAQPTSATAVGFARQLSRRLPDSLRYLTTYLREPLWFDFRLGRVANLVNGLTVELIASKWRETQPGFRQPIPINDYVPLVVLNSVGREIYRTLAHPDPDKPEIQLPALPDAHTVVVDPLGAWPERNKRNNRKQV